jgi:nucleotide-binding universal stress UspA family protein
MKILLAIDGSKFSELATEALIRQYKPQDNEVRVLHAVESSKLMPIPYCYGAGPMFVQDFTAIVQRWRAEGESLVNRTAGRLQSAGFKTTTQVEEGDARDLIVECGRKWRPDVIVLGSHGKRGLDRLLLGSVSEAVARHAPCSVEIVRATAAAA